MPSNTARRLHVRWVIRRDMEKILAIEAGCPDPWDEDDYLTALRERRVISMVVEGWHSGEILGVMVYQLFETHLKLLRFAVAVRARRVGVGQELMAKLAYKCCSHRRTGVYARVPDGALDMQCFLRACGWRAEAVVGSEYLMEFTPQAVMYENLGVEYPVKRLSTWEEK